MTLPPVDELTAPWWDATRARRLVLQHCTTCQAVQHYPRRLCTGCGAIDGLDWISAAGAGTVDTFTVVHRAPAPEIAVPFVLARVRLAEGPVLLTHLVDVVGDEALFGAAVQVDWCPLTDGRNLPVFRITEPRAQEH
ncbi:MAG: Zn-ribbon domain-containing OB-fold protein [Jatrophihabitantaceae bacterium]